MKKNLLGLLSLLTLLPGCNLNHPEVNNNQTHSVLLKGNDIKRLSDRSHTFNEEGVEYDLILESDVLYIQFKEKVVDNVTYIPYLYELDDNGKVKLLANLTERKEVYPDFENKEINIIYVNFSLGGFDASKVKFEREYNTGGNYDEYYYVFSYDVSNLSSFFNESLLYSEIFYKEVFRPQGNYTFIHFTYNEALDLAKINFRDRFEKANPFVEHERKTFILYSIPSDFKEEIEVPEETEGVAPTDLYSVTFNRRLFLSNNNQFLKLLNSIDVKTLLEGRLNNVDEYYLKEIVSINYEKTSDNYKYSVVVKFGKYNDDSYTSESFKFVFNNVKKLNSLYSFNNVNPEEVLKMGYSNDISKIKELITLNVTLNENEELRIFINDLDITGTSNKKIKELIDFNLRSYSCNIKFKLIQKFSDTLLLDNLERISVNFIDDVYPVIATEIRSFRISNIDNLDIKKYVEAYDDLDGKITDFTLEKDDGGYFLRIKDKNKNVTIRRFDVDINEVYNDVIVLNDNIFELNAYKLYTVDELTKILNHIEGKEISDLNLDEYVSSSSQLRDIKTKYKVGAEEKELTLRIILKEVVEESSSKKENAFVLFFQKLGNWFRGVFTKWKWNCFITNEEWDERFN